MDFSGLVKMLTPFYSKVTVTVVDDDTEESQSYTLFTENAAVRFFYALNTALAFLSLYLYPVVLYALWYPSPALSSSAISSLQVSIIALSWGMICAARFLYLCHKARERKHSNQEEDSQREAEVDALVGMFSYAMSGCLIGYCSALHAALLAWAL